MIKEQLNEVRTKLAQLDPNNRDHLVEIAQLKAQEVELIKQAEELQSHEDQVTKVTDELTELHDNLVIDGVPVRTLFRSEAEYQYYKIGALPHLTAWAERYIEQFAQKEQWYKQQLNDAADREAQLQSKNAELQEQLQAAQEREFKLTRDNQDLALKRDAAVREAEEAKQEIERLKTLKSGEHITSEERSRQLKELSEKIKSSREPIYEKEPLDLNRSRYKAKYARTGEEFTFSYLEEGKYYEVDESEVQQFREQAERNHHQADIALDQSVNAEQIPTVAPEVSFPTADPVKLEVPSNVHDAGMDAGAEDMAGEDTDAAAPVTRADLEARLKQFAQEHGLVRGQVA